MKASTQPLILRTTILMIIFLNLGIFMYILNVDHLTNRSHLGSKVETGRIIKILEDNTFIDEHNPELFRGNALLDLEIMSGQFKGEIVESRLHISRPTHINFTEGDQVSIRLNISEDELVGVTFNSFERRGILVISVIVFFVALALIGGKSGLVSVVSLIFTLLSVIYILIPLILNGYSVILSTLGILTVVSFLSMFLLFGWSAKMITAFLGCMSGAILATVIAHLFGNLLVISGFNTADIEMLIHLADLNEFNLRPNHLFISGILIASLGVVLDTSVSIVSAMEEILVINPNLNANQLFKSGIKVGRDIMGTMSNTLILAFAGSSLNMMIILYISNYTFNHLLNSDFVALEVIRGIAGSLGIILTVPIVTYIGSRLLTLENRKRKLLPDDGTC